jgi:hypothetical protein
MSADALQWRNCWATRDRRNRDEFAEPSQKIEFQTGNYWWLRIRNVTRNAATIPSAMKMSEVRLNVSVRTPILLGRFPVASVRMPANKMMINSGLPRRPIEPHRMPQLCSGASPLNVILMMRF